MDVCAPRRPLRPGAKRWWDKTILNPLKSEAQGTRRLYQRRRDETSRLAYLNISQAYQTAIFEAKRHHWCSFLESLNPSTLFLASKYATSTFTVQSLPVPPLRNSAGAPTSVPEEQAELLFQGTSARTVPCDLSDLLSPNTLLPRPIPFTSDEFHSVISHLQPRKAPGRDEIPNQAIQARGKALEESILCVANSCLSLGKFPSVCKVARTAILCKPQKPDYSEPAAYRPIAFLSCLGKVVEAVLANRFKAIAEADMILL